MKSTTMQPYSPQKILSRKERERAGKSYLSRVGLDLVMHYAFPSCEQTLGWTPEEMCNKGPEAFVLAKDLPLIEAAQKQLMLHGVDATPTRTKRKSETLAWMEVNARVLKAQQAGEASHNKALR